MHGISSLPLTVLKLFPWVHHICKKSFEKSCICKIKRTHVRKFYFLPSKLKLAHKNWYNSYSSSKTHMGKTISNSQSKQFQIHKKTISNSQSKPQEHAFTRWRKIAYDHWAYPGQRSHISPYSWCVSYRSDGFCSKIHKSWVKCFALRKSWVKIRKSWEKCFTFLNFYHCSLLPPFYVNTWGRF